MIHDVFISYSSEDKTIADSICHILEKHDIKCWIAPRNIVGGEKFGDVIERAIKRCRVFIIIISKDSRESPYVGSELNLAFTDKRKIIPFKIDTPELEGEMRLFLNNKHRIEAYPYPELKYIELVKAVYSLLGQTDTPSEREKGELAAELNKIKGKDILLDNYLKSRKYENDKPNKSLSFFSSFSETVNDINYYMVAIEGGTFMMGSPETEHERYDDEKLHQVSLSNFYIGKMEVTRALWDAVMCDNPSYKGSNLPVENVSWNECQIFIQELNKLTGKKYSLPTEAQWEFAARGGNLSKGYRYAGSNKLDDVAWHNENSDSKLHPVGQKQANELGLYDMSGNVREWCMDWYDENYPKDIQTDPKGPQSGTRRVHRGGNCIYTARTCRLANRDCDSPGYKSGDLGFRLVLNPE